MYFTLGVTLHGDLNLIGGILCNILEKHGDLNKIKGEPQPLDW